VHSHVIRSAQSRHCTPQAPDCTTTLHPSANCSRSLEADLAQAMN
jgi:hypothetical protein